MSPQFKNGRTSRPLSETPADKQNFIKKLNAKINSLSKKQFSSVLIVIGVLAVILMTTINARTGKPIISLPPILGGDDSCTDILNPDCWTDSFAPKLKQTDGLTNALLIGLDSRDDNQGLMNTDTIIVASYDHSTGKTLLISFPRDLYVPYKINEKGPYYNRINAVYATGVARGMDGMELLETNVEDWLGIDIHYTAEVNFHTVTEVVDALGGITVNVEEDQATNGNQYVDVYPYKELSKEKQKDCVRAVDLPQYCVFRFDIGPNHLNGEEALIYARMRQYTSDFERARRQQQVIDAVKNKFLEDEETVDAEGKKQGMSKIEMAKFGWDLYQTIQDEENVKANVEYNDMLAGLFLLGKADRSPVQIVLDPEFGGGEYFAPNMVNGMYVLQIKGNSFEGAQKFISEIRENPDLYAEGAVVSVVNRTGKTLDATHPARELVNSHPPFKALHFLNNAQYPENGNIIYVFSKGKDKTLNYLKEYFNTEIVRLDPQVYNAKQSGYKEDIIVVIGPEAPAATPGATTTPGVVE